MTRRFLLPCFCALAGCLSGQPIEGLAPARDTGGPRIVYDPTRKPLPEIPFPNDLGTRPDLGSPTGLRLNSSLVAPSQLEQRSRQLADQLLPFYDRSTRTLILRPAVPLRQETRYAVILTSRLQDAQGRAVVPPGPGINHPAQDGELSPVLGRLPRGVRVEDIAFTWAF